jgi:hypothetical protein
MATRRMLNIRCLVVAFVLSAAILTALTVLAASAAAQNPVPFIDQPLVPDATAPGGPAFTLTVNGAGFVSGSVVNWNGSPRTTTFVSNHQLTASMLDSDIATASTAAVTVVNPSPDGGISNTQFFSIAVPETSVSFAPAVTYNSGGFYPGFLAVADVNGDGKPDIIVGNYGGTVNSVGVLLGNGDGTFQPVLLAYTESAGQFKDLNSVAVSDVNGDGKPDLIVAVCCLSNGDAAATVLLGNGDGTFRSPASYDTGGGFASALVVSDVNGDGKPDIVVTNWNGNSTVGVLLGNGDGTFQPALLSASPYDPGCLTIADVNLDGKPDALVCSQTSVAVLLGNGNGTFQSFANTNFSTGYCTTNVVVADVNGGGLPDMVASNAGPKGCGPNGFAGILLGDGDGTFKAEINYLAVDYTNSGVGQAAVADFNGDGQLDLVVASGEGLYYPVQGSVGVLLGNGDGTFQVPTSFGSGGVFAYPVVVADVNDDGKPDILVANVGSSTVGVLLNNTATSKALTNTVLASSLNPSVYGQAVTFTATVTSSAGTPTGAVELYNGSTVVGGGTLTSGKTLISISSLPAGSDSITGTYQGSATFAPSTSAPLSQVVKIASTTTALASSLNPAGTGQPVTFTATVTSQFGGAATGSVTFYSGTQTLGTASLSGNRATLSTSFTSSGTYSISAKYSGDSNNAGSTSSALSQVIITSTTTTLVSSLNPSLVGQAVTFTATVSSNAGTPPNGELITFKNGSSVLGTAALSGGIAALSTSSLSAGIYTITATYNGDANFTASTSPILRQVVNSTSKSATSTTLSSSLNPSLYGQSITFKATVTTTGSIAPTGTVNFTWSGYSIGTATLNASGIATLTKSNLNIYTYPLVAAYSGDANNLSSTSSILNQVVKETTSAATLSSSPNPSTQGQAVTFTATITSPTVTPTGPVTFTAGKTVLGTAQLSGGKAKFTTSTLALDSTTVTATYNGDSNIAASSASLTQTVQQ